MMTTYIPKIIAKDYESFRRFLGADIPNTYNEWLKFADKEANRVRTKGNIPKLMEVNPDEFARYCAKEGTHRDFVSLKAFALQKADGHCY